MAVWAAGVWAAGVWADGVWFGMGGGVTPPVVAPQVTQTPAGRSKRQLVVIGDDVYDISSREELEALLDSRLREVTKAEPKKTAKRPSKPVLVIPKAEVSPMAKTLAVKFYKPGNIDLDWSVITRLVEVDEDEIEELILLH